MQPSRDYKFKLLEWVQIMHSFSINTPPLKHGQTYPPDLDIDIILVIEGIQGSNLSRRNERGRGRRISRNWARGASIFGGLRPTHRIYSRSVEFLSSRRHLDQYLRSREWRPRHARPSAAICEHAAAYARVPSRTRSVMHLPSAPSNVFPKRRTEIFLSIEPNDSSNIAREKEREKKLSIIEKKKDSFLIRDRFENERLRIIEGSVRKRGQWDNERRASGRYTVSLYFPW